MPLWPWFGSNRAWGKITPEVPEESKEEKELKELEEENKRLKQEVFDLELEDKIRKIVRQELEERDERR